MLSQHAADAYIPRRLRPTRLTMHDVKAHTRRITGQPIVPDQHGILYVVATPIGNLGDLSSRAREVLASVDLIAAEDTRRTRQLLTHFGLSTPVRSFHEHNEAQRVPGLIERLERGDRIALVSEAGTPLISDPGYRLVRAAAEAEVQVSPVPGPCAAIAALSVAGLPTDRFLFAGFLPARPVARRGRLEALAGEASTVVIYEAPHRIAATLRELVDVFSEDRRAILARELTKRHETLYHGTLGELGARVCADPDAQRGECVLVIGGAESAPPPENELERILRLLLPELSLKKAVEIVVEITGAKRNQVYECAVSICSREPEVPRDSDNGPSR